MIISAGRDADARRLYERLVDAFGEDAVIYADAADTSAVRRARAVLVLIGPRGPDPAGLWAVAQALDQGTRVIPVLVDRAGMPERHDLPPELQPLACRQGVTVSDASFEFDVDRLVAATLRVPPAGRVAPAAAELQRLLDRAARMGIVAAPSVLRRGPEWRYRSDQSIDVGYAEQAQRMEPLRARRRVWRALGAVAFAAVAGGVAYLIVDRLLGGLVLEPTQRDAVLEDDVACTVFAPPAVAAGDSLLVQAFVHPADEADDARALALEMDTDAARRVFHILEAAVARGSRLHFELHAPGLDVDDPVTSLVWRGVTAAVQFGVTVPPGVKGTIVATLHVSRDSAPLGHVKFKLAVTPPVAALATSAAGEPQGEVAHRYRAAFISYASEDRDEVLYRVQMLPLVGVRYFQDLLNLEPGDRWERRLELGIDECDLFLLFWSNEAKASEWVRQEVAHALRRRGDDDLAPPEIKPVIVEGPPVVEPWEELAHLHFNDRLIYFLKR